jgi:hypothetical protein
MLTGAISQKSAPVHDEAMVMANGDGMRNMSQPGLTNEGLPAQVRATTLTAASQEVTYSPVSGGGNCRSQPLVQICAAICRLLLR